MIKTIYKYPISGDQTLALPFGAKILDVQAQGPNDELVLWALCDPTEHRTEDHQIAVYSTGEVMPEDPGKYLATVQIHSGRLVSHIFDRTGP